MLDKALVAAALTGLGFGGLGARAAASHLRFFLRPATDPRSWTEHHGSALGGGCIASVTAFSAAVVTNALPAVPEFLIWLTPVALGVPVLVRQVRRGRG